MRELIKKFAIFLAFFLSQIPQTLAEISNKDKLVVEFSVITSGWYLNETCPTIKGSDKDIFKQNFAKASQVMVKNSSELEVKKINNLVSREIKKNKCDQSSLDLINKAFQLSNGINQQSSENHPSYSNSHVKEIYSLTLAVAIVSKCNFITKDQTKSLVTFYMNSAQNIDKIYTKYSAVVILSKLASYEALRRQISCNNSEKDFVTKIIQTMER